MKATSDDTARYGVDRRAALVRGACGFGLLLAGGGVLSGVLGGCQSGRSSASSRGMEGWEPLPKSKLKIGTRPPPRPYEPTEPLPGPGGTDWGLPSGVVPRGNWTRAGLANPSVAYAMNGINRITVHHDGMPPVALRGEGDVASRLESIRRAHVQKGWADIGYHFAIDPSGRVWEARSLRYQGAHVKDQNPSNLGIVVLGNFEEQTPTPQAVSALDRFVVSQMSKYRVPLNRVVTHRELAPTACPGRNLQQYMVRARSSGGAIAMGARSTGVGLS